MTFYLSFCLGYLGISTADPPWSTTQPNVTHSHYWKPLDCCQCIVQNIYHFSLLLKFLKGVQILFVGFVFPFEQSTIHLVFMLLIDLLFIFHFYTFLNLHLQTIMCLSNPMDILMLLTFLLLFHYLRNSFKALEIHFLCPLLSIILYVL